MDKIYVMTTDWENHWDKITETYYTRRVIHLSHDEIDEKTETIFIRIKDRETATIEHIYKGFISDCRERRRRVYFKVNLKEQLSELPNFINWDDVKAPGWYVIRFFEEDEFLPPVARNLAHTKDWQKFEKGVSTILKLIGITTIQIYDKQRGLPDGVFKFKTLAIIYDATLDKIENKQNQIQNYINLLRENKFKVTENEIWDISGYNKQVWIITRCNTTRVIRKEDEIVVKEVSIFDLIKLLTKRLKNINREDQLVEVLSKL
ncbi:MAG: hypothetical protein QXW01_03895 [Candidatus Aenigmatarchaeota archaeon]